jgi:hypothetical protein
MVLIDKFLDIFRSHAAVVNGDETALQEEVEIVKQKYGRWFRVRGFTDYHQFFYALHLAKAKKNPFTIAFLRKDEPEEGELILKQTAPRIRTYKYSDTQELASRLSPVR